MWIDVCMDGWTLCVFIDAYLNNVHVDICRA